MGGVGDQLVWVYLVVGESAVYFDLFVCCFLNFLREGVWESVGRVGLWFFRGSVVVWFLVVTWRGVVFRCSCYYSRFVKFVVYRMCFFRFVYVERVLLFYCLSFFKLTLYLIIQKVGVKWEEFMFFLVFLGKRCLCVCFEVCEGFLKWRVFFIFFL